MKVKKFDVPFAQVPNQLLVDSKISLSAKGLWAYLQSKPNDYDFSSERIIEETKEGIKAVQSGLRELENAGYLERVRLPSGRVDYILMVSSASEPLRPRGLKAQISKKDTITILNTKDTSITYETPQGTEVVEAKPSEDTMQFFTMVSVGAEDFQVLVSNMAEKTKFPPAMVASELKHFTLHWTERNKSGTKMRWETEKTFEVRRRLVTWFNNKRTNFGRNKVGQNGQPENKYQVGSFSRSN